MCRVMMPPFEVFTFLSLKSLSYSLCFLTGAAAVVVWAFFFDFLPLAKVAVEAPDRSSSESRQIRYRFIM